MAGIKMAATPEEELTDLKMYITNSDVMGVTDWFRERPHVYDKASVSTDAYLQALRKGLLELLQESGRFENTDIFDIILRNVYQSTSSDVDEESLFHFLLREGSIPCLEKIINLGCDVNGTRRGHWTPLMLLVDTPFQVKKTKFLVSQGADINKLGSGHAAYGPLHYAVLLDDKIDIIPTLLTLGADVNLPCRDTRLTPLHLAMTRDNTNIADYLLEKGANPRIMSCEGETALDLAIQKPHFLRVFLRRNIIMHDEGCYLLLKVLIDWSCVDLMSLELLLQSGCKCSREEWVVIRDQSAMNQYLEPKLAQVESLLAEFSFRPRSLLDLSCFSVRGVLSTYLPRRVNDLPVPVFIKRCVKLEHYLGCVYHCVNGKIIARLDC